LRKKEVKFICMNNIYSSLRAKRSNLVTLSTSEACDHRSEGWAFPRGAVGLFAAICGCSSLRWRASRQKQSVFATAGFPLLSLTHIIILFFTLFCSCNIQQNSNSNNKILKADSIARLHADSIASVDMKRNYDSERGKITQDSLSKLDSLNWLDETDVDVRNLIQIDTIRISSKNKCKAQFVEYILKGKSKSVRLFNQKLKKTYKRFEKSTIQELQNSDGECDTSNIEFGIYNNDLKFLSDNAFSIIIKSPIYNNETWFFENYIIIDDKIVEVGVKDLLSTNVLLDSINYNFMNDSIEIGDYEYVSGNDQGEASEYWLNFGVFDYKKVKQLENESIFISSIYFSFSKNGIKIYFQWNRNYLDGGNKYYADNGGEIREMAPYKIISYEKLKPFMRPEIYNLLANH